MHRLWKILAATVGSLLLGLAPIAVAQEAAPAAPDAAAQFDAAFASYKQTVSSIEKLRVEFQEADQTRRDAIDAELKQLVDQAQDQLRQTVTAGVATFQANPNAKPEVAEMLKTVARHYVVGTAIPQTAGNFNGGDQFEAALPILKGLIEGGATEPEWRVWAFVSAVMTNDFDYAEQMLGQLRDQQILEQGPPNEEEATIGVWGTAQRFADTFDTLRDRWQKEAAIRAAEAQADNLPRVELETSKGKIVIELFEDQAPIATANFISLVKKGFYNGVVFHRVLQGFMAQGGDPTGTGSGGPGYSIACECAKPDARQHFRGSLSMAHAGKDTGGSQFFLTFVPTDFLDGRHTVFGRVVEGIEVIGDIQRIDPQGQGTKPQVDKIVSAKVLRDRGHGYEFPKLPGR